MRNDRIWWVRDVLTLVALAVLFALILATTAQYGQQAARLRDALRTIEELQQQENPEGGAESAVPDPQPTGPGWTWPIAEADYLALSSPFGERKSPIWRVERHHDGIDIYGIRLSRIVAVGPGRVLPADEAVALPDGTQIVGGHWPPPDGWYKGHPTYGGLVIVDHGEGWYSFYGHLSSTRVRGGQVVAAGEVIGRQGATGLTAGRRDGAHLHFGLLAPGPVWVNPELYVQAVTP